jgi:hypothetical protein
MFIDPLVELKVGLCYEQRLELGFVCSLLNNPLWFNKTITLASFGSWQGGMCNRLLPCGGEIDMLKTIGAHPDASTGECMAGESELTVIVELLYRHLCWVDSLQGRGNNRTADLPLAS